MWEASRDSISRIHVIPRTIVRPGRASIANLPTLRLEHIGSAVSMVRDETFEVHNHRRLRLISRAGPGRLRGFSISSAGQSGSALSPRRPIQTASDRHRRGHNGADRKGSYGRHRHICSRRLLIVDVLPLGWDGRAIIESVGTIVSRTN